MTQLRCLFRFRALPLHGLFGFAIVVQVAGSADSCSGAACREDEAETSFMQVQSLLKPGAARGDRSSPKNHFDFLHDVMNKKFSIIHEKPSRIAIASQCGESYGCNDAVWAKTFQNHQEYARKHNYEFFLLEQPLSERRKVWDRYPLISLLHKRGAEWVMYMDADTLVMNTSVDAANFIEQYGSGKDLIISGDFQSHYQSGVFLMRNSERMRKSMCNAWKICPSPKWQEQGAMMIVLGGGDPADESTWKDAMGKLVGTGVTEDQQSAALTRLPGETQELLALLPQGHLDSYAEQARTVFPYWTDVVHTYKPGEWMIHFPGLPYKAAAVNAHLPYVSFMQPEKKSTVDFDPSDCQESSCCGPRLKVPEDLFDCSDV